jgi:hypothetical protein
MLAPMRRGILILVAVVGLGLVALDANAKVIFVTTTADVLDGPACSLRDAVRSANTDTPKGGCLPGLGDDEIVLPAGTYTTARAGAGEDAAATGDYDVLGPGSLTVSGDPGGGTVIDAAGIDRAFDAPGVLLTQIDLTIRGGNPGHGDTWPRDGGAIMATGVLTLERVVIEGNRTATGDETGIPPYPDPGGSGGAVAAYGTLVVRDSVSATTTREAAATRRGRPARATAATAERSSPTAAPRRSSGRASRGTRRAAGARNRTSGAPSPGEAAPAERCSSARRRRCATSSSPTT